MYCYSSEPEIKIFTERTTLNHLAEIFVGCADNTEVHRKRSAATKFFHNMVLDDPEQSSLSVERKFRYFIKKNSSTLSAFKASLVVFESTGERSLGITKKFAVQKSWSNATAVDGNERFIPSRG